MIHIRDLRLSTIIGVHARERAQPQEVVLNLEIETDLAGPARSDELADAVDYGALVRAVATHVEASRCFLIEKLAASVGQVVLDRAPAVAGVTVTVDKPGATPLARSVGVTVRATRPG